MDIVQGLGFSIELILDQGNFNLPFRLGTAVA